ncbi:MAG: AraC-like DNA-binding protein [Myxococcota bacterium]|jgi:AraC-like DNA-binding protein
MTFKVLAERINRLLEPLDRPPHDAVPGLYLLHETQPTEFEAMIYDPVVCLILQGEKETTIGNRTFTVSAGECVVISHDTPVLARITQASADRPYLAVVIPLDLGVLRSLYDEVGDASFEPSSACCMEVAAVDEATVAVMTRYVDLLDDAASTRVLLPLVRKELHFRLYMSAAGTMLRSLLRRDSHASHVSLAIRTMRANFRERLAIPDLAKSAGMSTSSFHRHFRAVTMTTPLQYQKDLRLTEARRLLRAGQHSVSAAAFDVGYESPSQFSREYTRKFGAPPLRDLSQMTHAP